MSDDSLSRIIGSVDRRKRRNLPRGGATRSTVVDERTSSVGPASVLARGPVILNPDFVGGAYWGVDPTQTSNATADVTTPTYGNMDVDFSAGFGDLLLKQLADPATAINTDATGDANLRYWPCSADDVITIVGHVERQDTVGSWDTGLIVYVEYFDADKVRVGGEFTTSPLIWEQGGHQDQRFGGNTGDSRRQASFQVGHERLEDDFTTSITEDQRRSIRYLAFYVDTFTNANATSVGLRYLQGWSNAHPIVLDAIPDMEGVSVVGDDVRLRWSSDYPVIVKVHMSLEGRLLFEEIDVDPDNLPVGTFISDFVDDFNYRYQQDYAWDFEPVPFGARVHWGALAMTDAPDLDAAIEYARRSGVLLRGHIDNTRQLVNASNQRALPYPTTGPTVPPPYRRTVHSGSDESSAPNIDFAYGPRHTVTLDANCSPVFHLTQPLQPGTYDTLAYDYTGTVWELVIKQDATGGRTFTWPAANTEFAGGTSLTVSAGANAVDRFRVECTDSDETTPVFLVSAIAQNVS